MAAIQQQKSALGHSQEPPILTLSRDITVRTFRLSDAESVAKHGNDKQMWLNGPDFVPFPFTVNDGTEYIKKALDTSKWITTGPSWVGPARSAVYAICLNDIAIGSIEFMAGEDIRARGAHLGYWIGREFWGQGIATEVLAAFVAWIWETFPKFMRFDAEVYDYNLGSGKVLKKVGFEHLTTLKNAVWKDNKLAGLELWGLVRPGLG